MESLGKWLWSFDKVIRGAMIILARKRLRSTLCFLENRGKIAPRKLLGIMERIMVALTVFRKKGVLTERKDKVFLEIEFYDKFSCIFIISRYLNY